MKFQFFKFVGKIFSNRFKYFWFHQNPVYFESCTFIWTLKSNFRTTAPFSIPFIFKINIYILTMIQINIYVLILFKINFSSLLFKIIHFKYSKFIKIAKIKKLNWPRFLGYYNLPHLKLFVPEKERSRKLFNNSTQLPLFWLRLKFFNFSVSKNFSIFQKFSQHPKF